MMVHGFHGEEKIVKDLEAKHGIPVNTSGRSTARGDDGAGDQELRRRDLLPGSHESDFCRYFTEAGFEVAAMEGIEVPFKDVGKLSGEEIYKHTKKAFLKHADADAIYMLGSGWRLLKIVRLLEQDLQVPVVYALAPSFGEVAEAVSRARTDQRLRPASGRTAVVLAARWNFSYFKFHNFTFRTGWNWNL